MLVPVRASPVTTVLREGASTWSTWSAVSNRTSRAGELRILQRNSLAQHWARDWRALALTQVHHGSRLSDSREDGEALSSVHSTALAAGKLIHNLLWRWLCEERLRYAASAALHVANSWWSKSPHRGTWPRVTACRLSTGPPRVRIRSGLLPASLARQACRACPNSLATLARLGWLLGMDGRRGCGVHV